LRIEHYALGIQLLSADLCQVPVPIRLPEEWRRVQGAWTLFSQLDRLVELSPGSFLGKESAGPWCKKLKFTNGMPTTQIDSSKLMETSMNQSIPNTRDGFQVVRDHLAMPTDSALDQKTKRALAICHLFLNRNMAISDIVWLLGEDNRTVVLALLEQGIIQERRTQPRPVTQENERRKSITGLRTTEIYARLRS
jgi:hypothetical protein